MGKYILNCAFCGSEFTADSLRIRYCSDGCRASAIRQQNAASLKKYRDRLKDAERIRIEKKREEVKRDPVSSEPFHRDNGSSEYWEEWKENILSGYERLSKYNPDTEYLPLDTVNEVWILDDDFGRRVSERVKESGVIFTQHHYRKIERGES